MLARDDGVEMPALAKRPIANGLARGSAFSCAAVSVNDLDDAQRGRVANGGPSLEQVLFDEV